MREIIRRENNLSNIKIKPKHLFALKTIQTYSSLAIYLTAHPEIIKRFQEHIIECCKSVTDEQRKKVAWEYKVLTKKISASERMLWWALQRKWKRLGKNFYVTDKQLFAEIGICLRTIRMAKKVLAFKGKIRYKSGLYTGIATTYEYVEVAKNATSNQNDLKRWQNLPKEVAKNVKRGSIDCHPTNITNITNNKKIPFNEDVCKLIHETAINLNAKQ